MADSKKPILKDLDADAALANKRRFGRVICQDVSCTLGPLLDLSAGGARVQCRVSPPKVGARFNLGLRTLDGEMFIACLCRWSRRKGMLCHEVGLEFCDVTPQIRSALVNLARAAAHNEVLRPGAGGF